jgi:hypothetical protein
VGQVHPLLANFTLGANSCCKKNLFWVLSKLGDEEIAKDLSCVLANPAKDDKFGMKKIAQSRPKSPKIAQKLLEV